MQASFFIRIFSQDYVPSVSRAAWLDRHGGQPASVVVECVAPLSVWEACGYDIQTDGMLERSGSGSYEGLTRVCDWRSMQVATRNCLRSHLQDFARDRGHLPPQPYEVGELLSEWLPRHRAELEARELASREREAENRRANEERDAQAREQRTAEQQARFAERRSLLERWGTPEQIERLLAGVLPEGEFRVVVAANALPRLPEWEEITEDEVRAECEENDCEVSVEEVRRRSDQPGEMSAEQWRSYRSLSLAVETAVQSVPGLEAEVEVWEQRGWCQDSEHEVQRLALDVTWRIAGLRIDRRYAIGATLEP